jgi:hypothetical protein
MALVLVEGLLKNFGPARLLPLQTLHRCADVLDGKRFFGFLMADYGLQLGIDLQRRIATGALDFKQAGLRFRHNGIVTHPETLYGRALSNGGMGESGIRWTRCAHPGCICERRKADEYCCDYCEQAGNVVERACGCGHDGCGVIPVLDEPGALIPEPA